MEVYDPYQECVEKNKLSTEVYKSLNKLQHSYKIIEFQYDLNQWKSLDSSADILIKLREKPISEILTFNPEQYKCKIIGKGDQFVYGLYIPGQKIESIINNYSLYPMKVGKTNRIERRIKELSISGIETLGVDLIIKTYSSTKLEKYIHNNLNSKLKQILVYGRKEWFLMNRKELENIYAKYLEEHCYF